ncbi:MAG: MBOAT family protein [Clostridia bacterium]|nr:MBOAT family protein [Clostridia bacterium]
MQFNSYLFILLFLPISVIAYFLCNKINKLAGKILIILASALFYMYDDWKVGIILGISLLINYGFAQLVSKSKRFNRLYMAIPVVINIGLLLYFKYTNFAISNINVWFERDIALRDIILPLGISFFTFQQIAYIVATFKKELENTSVVDYLAYILYFPKILMGPLADPSDFIKQLNDSDSKKVNWDNIAAGIQIFCFGLFKKVMLADIFAKAVMWGFANFDVATSMDWILVMLFYTFEIYFDFSGYSDMAVGTSLMFNITLPMNFDSPYKAVSVRDFWKRWHMSLTKFFTKYIYIPLGGSKKGKFFTYLNTLIVFTISGIWHGANWTFILWGVLYGLLMILDRVFEEYEKKVFEPARWMVTFSIINVLWLLFRSNSIQEWKSILKTILQFQNTVVSNGLIEVFKLPETTLLANIFHINGIVDGCRGFWMIIYIISSLIICLIPDNNYRKIRRLTAITMVLAFIAFVWGFICLSSESVFVYFNF